MFNRNRITTCLLTASIVISTCGCSNISSVTNNDINDDTNASVLSSTTTEVSPVEAMDENEEKETANSETTDIADYAYPDKFELTAATRGVIEQLAIWYPGDFEAEKAVKEETWQKFVIATFVQGNWDGYDYLKKIEENNNGLVSKEQVEYIQSSLTGIDIDFDTLDEDDFVDCYDLTGGSYYGNIAEYTVTSEGEAVEISAKFETGDSNGSNERTYDLEVTLQKNPKSCFDGYSVKSITKNDTTVAKTGDGSESYFFGWDMDYEDKDGALVFELGASEEGVELNGVVHVVVTEEQKKYIKDNSGEEFKISFVYTEDMQEPIEKVEAVSIEIIEN